MENFHKEIVEFSELDYEHTKNFPLNAEEITVLAMAKEANKWWFLFIMKCAMIMVERRNKYSKGHHPYFNFADVARRSNVPMKDVFKVYVAMKESRSSVSGDTDYKDESSMDTKFDSVNYIAIENGAILAGLTEEEVWQDDHVFSS